VGGVATRHMVVATASHRRVRTAWHHRGPFSSLRRRTLPAAPGGWMSRPVSRVLFPGASRRSRSATIHLGVPSPARSCGPPAGSGGPPSNACAPPGPFGPEASRPCSGWGLPSRPGHPGRWWSLTPPFHPDRRARRRPAVCSLWHCPAAHAGLPLTTTLPCGARTFLDDRALAGPVDAAARPTHPPLILRRLRRGATSDRAPTTHRLT